eukprot:TRINITY_DN9206_c0_g2_i3.p1 TRINITY_DN9206_c0_g2~~TRINITY_DN9206_c0_g2_i3.p1  ORF type:complete len:860 (-),score=130.33 TRINITY_DN9206_c0_g2_i3:86-2635(-)
MARRADPECSVETEGNFNVSEVEDVQSEDHTAADIIQQLVGVQEVFDCIFEYYATQGSVALKEPRLTSTKFQRMAMDAMLHDANLTHAKVDVTFARVCGNSPHMQLTHFRDAMVRLAAAKYPELPRGEAVLLMFKENLANFQGAELSGVFSDLDDACLEVLAASRPALQIIYEGYFGTLQQRQTAMQQQQRRASLKAPAANAKLAAQQSLAKSSAAQVDAQNCFVALLTDFEVIPELAGKPAAFSVFREVAKASHVPEDVRAHICPDDNRPGRFFTYCHFACALVVLSQRAFANAGAASLMRLLHWMDASKGRLLLAQHHPGAGKGVSNLKLMPEIEKLPQEVCEELPTELQRRRSSVSTAGPPPRTGTSSSNSAPRRRTVHHTEPVTADPAPSASSTRRSSLWAKSPSSPVSQSTGPSLPEWARLEVQRTFQHYASLGDPLNRTTMNSQKFVRFLRDCGLVSQEALVAKSYDFAPEGRGGRPSRSGSSSNLQDFSVPDLGSSTSSPGQQGGLSKSRSTGSISMRKSVSAKGSGRGSPGSETGRRFSVSQAARPGSPELPLKVFPVPLLSQVDADLVLIQAARASVDEDSTRKSLKASGKRLMTVDIFARALADVAKRCMPPEDVSGNNLEDFCQRVIMPLNELLLSSRSEDLQRALDLQDSPDVQRLLRSCAPGIEKIFECYASSNSRRPQWNAESITRFASDFDFLSEVSNLPLQRIFQDCSHHEGETSAAGVVEGQMGLQGFQLALIMLSQKIHTSQQVDTPEGRLPVLFHRINATASTAAFGARFGIGAQELLPLPKDPEGSTRRSSVRSSFRGSIIGSPLTSEKARSPDEADMSWAELVSGQTF